MKLGAALEELLGSVHDLASQLRVVGERHASQQDVYHMGHLLSHRMEGLAASLDPFLEAYGRDGDDGVGGETVKAFAGRVRQTISTMSARSSKTGLLLLRDLRELFVQANACEIDWTIVRQGAMAARDQDLMFAATAGQEETRRVVRWLATRIKEASPQILMTAD